MLTFEKTFSDADESDVRQPDSEIPARLSATWTLSRRANNSFSSFSAPVPDEPVKNDEYVDFMGGKRKSRYISVDDVDLDTFDLSVPAKQRYSRRWSDLVGGNGMKTFAVK